MSFRPPGARCSRSRPPPRAPATRPDSASAVISPMLRPSSTSFWLYLRRSSTTSRLRWLASQAAWLSSTWLTRTSRSTSMAAISCARPQRRERLRVPLLQRGQHRLCRGRVTAAHASCALTGASTGNRYDGIGALMSLEHRADVEAGRGGAARAGRGRSAGREGRLVANWQSRARRKVASRVFGGSSAVIASRWRKSSRAGFASSQQCDAVDRVVSEGGSGELAPDERGVVGVLGGVLRMSASTVVVRVRAGCADARSGSRSRACPEPAPRLRRCRGRSRRSRRGSRAWVEPFEALRLGGQADEGSATLGDVETILEDLDPADRSSFSSTMRAAVLNTIPA